MAYETMNGVGGYVPASTARSDAPETASRIRDGVGYAEQTLSELHETISQLERRLDTVLVPVPPSVASQGVQSRPAGQPASHVHGRLVILNEGYAEAVRRLRDLAQRVDV